MVQGNKWGLAPFIPKASLSSPSERNLTRSTFLTVFSTYSLRQARKPDRVGRRLCLNPFMGELCNCREEWNLNGIRVRLCHFFGDRAAFRHVNITCKQSLTPMGARPFPNTLIKQSRIWRYFL